MNSNEYLVQSFNETRSFVRSLFIYGYKNLENLSKKSSKRTHSTHLTRIQNWLMPFFESYKDSKDYKINYLKVDSHNISSNPLYLPLKSRTFKNKQLTTYFFVMSFLNNSPDGLTMSEIADKIQSNSAQQLPPLPSHDELSYLDKCRKADIIKYNSKNSTYSFSSTSLVLEIPIETEKYYTIEEILSFEELSCLLGTTKEQLKNTITHILQNSKKKLIPIIAGNNNTYCFKNARQSIINLVGNKEYTAEQMLNILRINSSTISLFDITKDILEETLKELVNLDLVVTTKSNPKKYKLSEDFLPMSDNVITAVQFFSEVDDLGFLGSTLLDLQEKEEESPFIFKHHYLNYALNTEVLYQLLQMIKEKKIIRIDISNSQNISNIDTSHIVLPLRLYRSTETGRTYLLSYYCELQQYNFCLLDDIESISDTFAKSTNNLGVVKSTYSKNKLYCQNYQQILDDSKKFTQYVWGISTIAAGKKATEIVVIFRIEDDEYYILNRLQREKRQGTITKIAPHSYKFSIMLADPLEIIPWLRSYIMRIEKIHFDDKQAETRFLNDFQCLTKLYNIDKEV